MSALDHLLNQLGGFNFPKPRDYVPCSFCGGGSMTTTPGCAACCGARRQKEQELDAEYKRQFPDGPKPFFTASKDNPQEMQELTEIFHADKICEAFERDGNLDSVIKKAESAMAKRKKS